MHEKIDHPTFQDIALKAGVSTSSVSRVLNNVQPISESLKKKVLAAAKEVGYSGLRKTSSREDLGSIAVLIPDGANPFFMELVKGIQDQAMRYGFITNIVVAESNRDYVRRILDWLKSCRCIGLIVCSDLVQVTEDELVELQEALEIPVVQIDAYFQRAEFCQIEIDYVAAMKNAAQHLLDLGHREFAYLGGMGIEGISNRKLNGIQSALAEAGIALKNELCVSGLPTIEWGFLGMNSLLDLRPSHPFTAILAHNDLSAIGALHAIRERGLLVPQDISLVGFDGISLAAHTNPPLTTVEMPKYKMGTLAMQMLVQKRQHSPANIGPFTLMECPLIVRDSTGPVRTPSGKSGG
jgi:LacI family transcriptional regulator